MKRDSTPKTIRLRDLVPSSPEQLRVLAYETIRGDMIGQDVGIHGRCNAESRDTAGRTKFDTFTAAGLWDAPWFRLEMQVRQQRPGQYPPSKEIRIPKGDGTTRPIGDPAEGKRLDALFARQKIEDRLEARMTPGQLGGRQGKGLLRALKGQHPCVRKGATPMDQVATLAQRFVFEGRNVAVTIDLANAFGLLPKGAVVPEVHRAGISKRATGRVWRLARLDAVHARTGKRIQYSKVMGVEQGGVLSATMLNVALAPILRAVSEALDVKVLAYVDDLYFFCRSVVDAEAAFQVFKEAATTRGFRNVRGLVRPGEPERRKASKIQVVTDDAPLVVLKRFQIGRTFIGMTPKVVEYVQQRMALAGIQGHLSVRQIRDLSGQQALSKKGTKITSRFLNPSRPKPLRGDTTLFEDPLPNMISTHGDQEKDERLPTADPSQPQMDTRPIPTAHDLGGKPVQPTLDHQRVDLLVRDRVRDRSSAGRRNQAPGTALASGNRGPAAGDARGTGQPGDASRAAQPVPLQITLPEIVERLRQRLPLLCGDRFKTARVDLRGLLDAMGQGTAELDLKVAVGAALHACRSRRTVLVVVDQREAWTALPGILGNQEDLVYERKCVTRLADGGLLLVLGLKRKPRKRSARAPVVPPPRSDITVFRVRRSRTRLGYVEVRVALQGQRPAWVSVPVGTVPAGAVAGGVAAVVGPIGARRVVVVAHPELKAILLLQPGLDGVARPCQPVFVPLRLAQEALRRWTWILDSTGCWLVGAEPDAAPPCLGDRSGQT